MQENASLLQRTPAVDNECIYMLTYVAEEVIGSYQGRRNIVSGTSSYRHDCKIQSQSGLLLPAKFSIYGASDVAYKILYEAILLAKSDLIVSCTSLLK